MLQIITVPGTTGLSGREFGRQWWTADGILSSRLRELFASDDFLFEAIEWDGKNSTGDRSKATERLRSCILETEDEVRNVIIAHSHGGNVALNAYYDLAVPQRSVDKIITIGTPYFAYYGQSLRKRMRILFGRVIRLAAQMFVFLPIFSGVLLLAGLAWQMLTSNSHLTPHVPALKLLHENYISLTFVVVSIVVGWVLAFCAMVFFDDLVDFFTRKSEIARRIKDYLQFSRLSDAEFRTVFPIYHRQDEAINLLSKGSPYSIAQVRIHILIYLVVAAVLAGTVELLITAGTDWSFMDAVQFTVVSAVNLDQQFLLATTVVVIWMVAVFVLANVLRFLLRSSIRAFLVYAWRVLVLGMSFSDPRGIEVWAYPKYTTYDEDVDGWNPLPSDIERLICRLGDSRAAEANKAFRSHLFAKKQPVSNSLFSVVSALLSGRQLVHNSYMPLDETERLGKSDGCPPEDIVIRLIAYILHIECGIELSNKFQEDETFETARSAYDEITRNLKRPRHDDTPSGNGEIGNDGVKTRLFKSFFSRAESNA